MFEFILLEKFLNFVLVTCGAAVVILLVGKQGKDIAKTPRESHSSIDMNLNLNIDFKSPFEFHHHKYDHKDK